MSKIRKAIASDIPDIAKLWEALVLEESPSAHPNLTGYCELAQKLFKMPNYYVFVAEDNGNIVGFNDGLYLTDLETREPYVQGGNFYVTPAYRKGPWGIELHRNSLEMVKKLNAKFLRRKVSPRNKRMTDRLFANKRNRFILKEYIVDEMIGGRQ